MAVTSKQLVREFKYNKEVLLDIDPSLSPEAIMEIYSNQHPELLNASVTGPKIENDKAVYEFSKNLGTKG